MAVRPLGRRCWRRLCLAGFLLLAMFLGADVARAQREVPAGPEGRAARLPPRDLYGRALDLARQGQWDRAAPLFDLVAQLGYKNALWNLAECYRHLGRPATALTALERFLRHPRLTPRERKLAEQEISALRARTARLTVTGNPAGAVVIVDGRELGRTPLTGLDLNPGPHVVEVTSPGFQPRRREVTLAPGAAESLDLSLQPLPARLRVVTRPPGARVRAGGVELGTAPVEKEVTAGQVDVEARLSGHRISRRRVIVEPGREKELVFELSPASGLLSVATDPPAAALTLDGAALGAAPLASHRLSPGPRRLSVERAGYLGWSTSVDIQDGQSASLQVSLARRGLHRWVFATATSASLALAVGGAVALAQAHAEAGAYAKDVNDLRGNAVALDQVPYRRELARVRAGRVDSRYVTSVGLFAAAGATAGLAAVLAYFTRWRLSRGELRVVGSPAGAGVSAGGSF